MNRYFSQQEENFWPCVSDMFLALFIIALALFSQARDHKKDADIRQEEFIADETCRLIETLSDAFPSDEHISSLKKNTERIREQHDKDDPCRGGGSCEMNRALTQLPQSTSVQHLLGHQPNSVVEFDNKEDYHSKAVDYFFQFVIPGEERRGTSDGTSDGMSDGARLSLAHQEILHHIIEQTKDKIKVLTSTVDKDRAELLKMLAEARADVKRKDERIEQLRRDIEKYKAELRAKNWELVPMKQEIKEKDEQIAKLKERLGEDMRPRIMDKLQRIIDDEGCGNLVQVERREGVLHIPSTTLAFKTWSNSQSLSKPFADRASEDNFKKIAWVLYLFMEDESKEHLVDTIIIEGHADPQVQEGADEECTNAEASSWRALGTWYALNNEYFNKFANYRNKNGKAIFGIAGYGSRNRLEKQLYESDEHYNERCRRIDIRFIPAPKSDL